MSSTPQLPYEVRSIVNRKELEEVFDLIGEVFPVGRAFFQQRLDNDSTYELDTTWIAKSGDTIASTIQLFPFRSRIETAHVKIGGIGSVATLPEYRGQGMSQAILKAQTEWMEAQEYDLSLLFAVITPFYEKSGWEVVPEPVYEIEQSALAAVVPPIHDYEIVPFDPAYTNAIADIYEQFNRNRTYSVIRPPSFWPEQLKRPRWQQLASLVALKNGKPVAYGSMRQTSEGVVHLEELLYTEHEAAVPLFLALAKLRPDADKFSAKLPRDHVLAAALSNWGADLSTINYAMWKVLRMQPMLAKLSEVFARRLNGQALSLHLSCAGQHAYLHTEQGKVLVEASPAPGVAYDTLEVTQTQLVTMLFQGIDEQSDAKLQSDLLLKLFPVQSSIFYLTDQF